MIALVMAVLINHIMVWGDAKGSATVSVHRACFHLALKCEASRFPKNISIYDKSCDEISRS